ncbi:MAG: DUF4139 domain-containing protein [Flavobacteriales bacterium]|nr:DUF4139 domain-containing protein [Flavobacteriales bacterium]
MKNIILLLTTMIITSSSFGGDEKIVPSKISKVTVYSQGAQIYRKANYSIGKGVTEVVIDGVSDNIDGNSLQVNATGNSIILDTKYSLFYPENKAITSTGLPLKIRRKIGLLEDSIAITNYTLRELQDEIDVYTATKSILANNGAIRGQGKVNDSIGLLKHAIEYYTVKMMEVNKKLNKLNQKKSKSQKKQRGMNQRLTDLKNFQTNGGNTPKQLGPSYRITVTFKSDVAVTGKLDISYLVSNAGWTPMYDLRSDATSSKINLNYKANVHQNTGIDWKDVRLNISTNNPYHNKTKPTLHPWYVDFNIYKDQSLKKYKEGKNRGNIPRKAAEMDYAADAIKEVQVSSRTDAFFNASAAGNASSFVTVVDNLISAEFRIDLPYSIKSNNQKHMVLIKNVDINANYKYYTVPKYDKSVYLVAQLSKLDELQLVPAKANIFFDGTYMGETYINPSSMDDTLSLSLGKDPNIIVNRVLMQKECKTKVVGTKTERTFAYSIEVKNLKSRTIKLVVQDQIPITTNADIEIETLDISKGKLNKKNGLIEWEFNLKPKQKKELSLSYKVKYDKDKNLVVN